ncbi:MAG: hypothetical protein IJY82_08275 [Oscillospiraceae bacterium]|nr:hypothetical protein [Oscillospiraceae bacterium]
MKRVLAVFLAVILLGGCVNAGKSYTEAQLFGMIREMTQATDENPMLGISSNPYEYIRAHRETYQSLVEGGMPVAQVFIRHLEQTGKNGLEEYLMAIVCAEITGVDVEKEIGWSTAQEWLTLYKRNHQE